MTARSGEPGRARVGPVQELRESAASRQAFGRLVVETRGPGFVPLTDEVSRFVAACGLEDGLLTLFCRHTSASLAIQENADPDVTADLMTALDGLAPRDQPYRHGAEGPDDMPAHIRTLLTHTSLQVPVLDGRLLLGTWQGIYLVEHRDRPHRREVIVHVNGA